METRLRSLVKAIIWQVLGLIVMFAVAYLITGSVETGGAFALINSATGFLTYILYERIWSKVQWGRQPRVAHG
ncbi:MAG: DUF2061 domain-containing protein [Pseudoruegeria sp.]